MATFIESKIPRDYIDTKVSLGTNCIDVAQLMSNRTSSMDPVEARKLVYFPCGSG